MAIIKNGILGGFNGKSATVVGYRLRGQDCMRGVPKERSVPTTDKELKNQSKFKVTQPFLQALTPFLRVGFKDYDPKFEGFNAAKSYNSKNAVKEGASGFYVDPALVLVSFGDMDQAAEASASSESANTVTFKWEGGEFAHDDRAMVVVYDIDGGTAEYDTAATNVQKKKFVFELNKEFSGKKAHAYLAFVSEDRKRRSKSQYLGVVEIQ